MRGDLTFWVTQLWGCHAGVEILAWTRKQMTAIVDVDTLSVHRNRPVSEGGPVHTGCVTIAANATGSAAETPEPPQR